MSVIIRKDKERYSEITINRPEALNSLNLDVVKKLIDEIEALPKSTKVVVLRGAGEKSFVAGADIKAMESMQDRDLKSFAALAHQLMNKLETSSFIVVACVQGYAFGGGLELALACDLILATDKAKFSLPELNLGLIPGFGGTQRLLQKCGLSFARKLIYTSEVASAQAANAANLVDYLVNSLELEQELSKLVNTLLAKSPESLMAAKKSIFKFNSENLNSGLQFELEQFAKCFSSKNGKEGLKAFLEKRSPEFK